MFINQIVKMVLETGKISKNGVFQVKNAGFDASIKINHSWVEIRAKIESPINIGDEIELYHRILVTDTRYDIETEISVIIYDEWGIPFYKPIYKDCHYTP